MSSNTLVHRIVRPAVRAVAPTGVTPNHITTLRLLTGIAAALAFAHGGAPWPAISGAIFAVSFFLDRADGELARQTGQSSPGGHRYDLIADCASGVIAFLGIGVGVMPALGVLGPLLGALAGINIGALFWQINALQLVELRPWSAWNDRFNADPDDAMILVPVLIWCGAAVPMLFAAAAITLLAALWLGLRRARPGRAGQES
jgi:archaetidylinositol phosphate synthase